MTTQAALPGLEDYVCTFQCLTHCPFPDGPCPYDDPDMRPDISDYDPYFEAEFHVLEFEFWRDEHEGMVHPVPDDPYQTRCPRCYALDICLRDGFLFYNSCEYNEPLIDFPDNMEGL